ncbi:Fe-S oxidoreductase [Fontimonas thermophila]|uniref:Fe-S oxidoreductase n=1 Tax=Fontimonas thermophila TaxID=1076937 RepID=A0A1I2I9C8_9GAMM|nr:heterodisulfide reductase-related iron-sulfur binding cluster [Fontimonas thermophila]SFF38293.1 Fe-S oxidoreductase [Fontimonas thermophila]
MNESFRDRPSAEGGLQAPTRHPLPWRSAEFWDRDALEAELYRVFDICHGCRRCVSLCHAFPTLFDLVDASPTMELDAVAKSDYAKVVEQCYLCDLCYQTKCPYVPPHEWNVDFPHLMLRAKAQAFRRGEVSAQHRRLTDTTRIGRLASIPVVAETVNAINRSPTMRKAVRAIMGVHPDARVPEYHHPTARRRLRKQAVDVHAQPAGPTRGRVALFVTCYGNHNMPQVVEDLVAVFRHNGISVRLLEREQCCGMPKLELGDLDCIERYAQTNLPVLAQAVREGWDITAPIPSCVLMFRQEIPLLFPESSDAQAVRAAIFDPFEYLMHRHKAGLLNTEFKQPLGKVAYHAPCHQRVQNIGPKTRELLSLIPGTQIEGIERCSGHDGTYGVRDATYERAMKIARPVVSRIRQVQADHISSDCPMAGEHLAHGVDRARHAVHPISLLRRAYGI